MSKIIPVILCGGSGTRLWPMSRPDVPKQFINLFGDLSLVQETATRAARACGASSDEFVCVTLGATENQLAEQLKDIDVDYAKHILCEPSARNTSAAVAFAAHYIANEFGTDSIMWVLPSDHYIGDEVALKASLMKALEAAEQGYLTTFGIVPTRAETGYGYIRYTEKEVQGGAFEAAQFVEKPDEETAQSYVESGDYLWNSGMFVFRTDAILEGFSEHASSISKLVEQAMETDSKHPSAEIYAKIPKIPFDTAVMEKSDKVAVVPCNMNWSDVGSWESLWENREKDQDGNVVDGNVIMHDSENCLVYGSDRVIACAGLKNIVVVDTGDALMIIDKSSSDNVKLLVESVKDLNQTDSIKKIAS